MNVKDVRRENMRALARNIGGISAMAAHLGKSQGQISHLIGASPIKNIGDKIAAEVEQVFNKPHGWLDREHPEIHGMESTSEIYATVPLIDWDHIATWQQQDEAVRRNNPQWIVANLASLSPKAFALKVEGDTMAGSAGPSFPDGSTIIVDPELTPQAGAFVVAANGAHATLTFKELCLDGGKRYLKPLNPRYPLEALAHDATIFGVVKQMLQSF